MKFLTHYCHDKNDSTNSKQKKAKVRNITLVEPSNYETKKYQAN